MTQTRKDKRIWLMIPVVFVAMFLFSFFLHISNKDKEGVSAANLANFQAGYIISDWQMTNYDSMSEAEIQNWLTAKNPCNNTNYNYYLQLSNGSSHRWHYENGHFICLSEERFGDRDGEIGFQYGETAAHIIWQAAQDYKINPKVLIVLLQKETGLITDKIPNDWDYRRATGYGCPDTAACSEKYYGFKNQVRNAAYLFRIVMDGNSSYYPIGNNYIQYNPNAACGGSMVNVRNLATSALYRYTPYQPNAGALAAGYGTATCGAYGNRNFYAYFEDWFGEITSDGLVPIATVLSRNRVANEANDLEFEYRTHIQQYGWLDWVNGGAMAGTAGYSLAVEAINIQLRNMTGVEYRTYVRGSGWEENYKKDGEMSGETGKSLKLEGVQIRLSGDLADKYDVHYRVHVANVGWMDWVKNDEIAGVIGGGQIEALQVKILKKATSVGVMYSAHAAVLGWMDWVKNGEIAGTTGQSRQVEAMMIELTGAEVGEYLRYKAHAAVLGWMDWVKNGEIAGTTGQSRQVEAMMIELTNGLEKQYDVYYRVHVANVGWMDWVKNGEIAGTTGRGLQMEAIEIKLVEK